MLQKQKTPPLAEVAAPDPSRFVWKKTVYDLSQFTEFRYWYDHSSGKTFAKFLRAGGGEVSVPVQTVSEAQTIERAVNPFWGRN